MKRTIFGVGCVVALLPVFASNAHEYWPLVNGAVYQYTGPDGSATATVQTWGDYFAMGVVTESGDYAGLEISDDSDGRLLMYNWTNYYNGEAHPIFSQLRTPHELLPSPLEPESVWESHASIGPLFEDSILFGVVGEQTELNLPAGSFSALEVSIYAYGMPLFPSGTFFVAPGVGVVKFGNYELASMQVPVATDAVTWGEVKALYR